MNYLVKCFKILLLIILHIIENVWSSPELYISNNAPSMLDSNITFTAILLNYEPKNQLTYVFDDGTLKKELKTRSHNVSLNRSFPSSLYKADFYSMNVSVLIDNLFYDKTIASNFSRFELKKDLIGEISVFRSGQSSVDVDEVAVGENVSLVVNLVDHSNFLQKAAIDYSWSIDFEKHQTLDNILIYNFTEVGSKDIKAFVTAVFPNNDFRYGFFERTITAKDPVTYVNISGNPFLYHGDKLNLNVTCNGSPPYQYCFQVLKRNASSTNFTCMNPSTFTTCHMEIIKYFQNDGMYQIGIYVSNDVQAITRVIEVMVYSVSIKPTLSTIIIPIVCSLLTLIIIAFGISYYVQHRNQLAVEVANFDFQDDSNSYTEKTFFENFFDSFACRSCTCSRLSCDNQSEAEPLM
ncbi:uncharacterized protein LOC129962811 [Argiope bruennichi]|uniref:uncharacterized protein LOC129962811 n=1 Tax=Argiope bruennichi TaxID=94029 RepID=UPI00249582CD|nr:uncharacterized protein LOC129962811 [Argiope bruennichi]